MKPALHIAAILFFTMALPGSPAFAATVYTGDTIEGKKVISQLDLTDLAPGQMHRFMFRGAETATSQYWYVPVLVAKGAQPGKRILFIAGVHGDELNPVAAVQATFATLDPAKMTGSAIAVIGPSRPSIENITRTWTINDLGGEQINPNRTWPGREDGNVNDTVAKGQKIAIQRNGFGEVVHEYLAPADGRVAVIGTDAATERGGRIAYILVDRASCADGQCDVDDVVP